MNNRFCILIMIALSLSGCTTLAPRYKSPKLPVPPEYSLEKGGAAQNQEAVAASAAGWRTYFANKNLQELIEQALKHNRDIRIAILQIEEARALYKIQRADLVPTISTNGNMEHYRTSRELRLPGQKANAELYDMNVASTTWELDVWGRIRNLKDAAFENFLATDVAHRAVALSLIAEVADSYLRLREFDERLLLTHQTIASREDSLRIFTRRLEEGAVARLEVTQVETLLLQAKTIATQLQQLRAGEAHFLGFLTGYQSDLTAATTPFNDNEIIHELRPGLSSELLVNRPDIIAAEHELRAANLNIGVARAAFFPRVILIGSWGTMSADLSSLFGAGTMAWNYGPRITIPVFAGGRNRANLKLANVRRDMTLANYEKTIQLAFREVSDALTDKQFLTEQTRHLQRNLEVQKERTELAKTRYDRGSASFLEVLDAQRDLLSAEQDHVESRRALLSSRVRLYAALGGGAQYELNPVNTPKKGQVTS